MKLTNHEGLRASGWLGLLLIELCLMGLGSLAHTQAFSTTTVQGTVYLANGQPGTGTLVVSWPSFTTASGQLVTAASTTMPIAPDGFVSVSLAPNQGATPAGLYYTAIFYLSDGAVNTQYWVVPAAASATLGQVQAQLLPSTQAVQTVSKAYVDQAIAAAAVGTLTVGYLPTTGGTLTGPLYLSGDPTQPLQAADKHYVDENFAEAVPLAGGTMTGPLTATKLGAVYQVDQFAGADFGAKLGACLSGLSSIQGGTCDARNFSGTLAMGSNLTISTGNATVLLPCATIWTANQVVVTAGTRNVTLRGCALRGASTASGSQGGTVFYYSGTGAMVQVGDPTYVADTMGFHLDNVAINITAATSASAQGLAAYRTQELDLESLYFLGNSNQTGMTLDGTGNYTGGTFYDNEFTGFRTAVNAIGHQITNPATTDWMNASTFVRLHIDCPTSGGSPVSGTYGINLQQGDGNTFTGGDVEGCSTALHLGANAQNNTIVGLRNENSTNQVVADTGSSYNSWMTGGTMFTGALTDNGTRNSFLDTFHRSFNGLNGDWYGSQKDATVTNHLRLGIGAGNERGLLNEIQTDYGYRWTEGYTDATAGEQFYQVQDLLNNVNRLSVGQYNNGQSSTNNQTVINAAGTGAVVLNGSNNSGTGGVVIGSGGTSETTVATVNNAGNAQFNGTLQVGGTSTFLGSTTVKNQADAEIDATLWAGLTTSQKESFIYKDWNGTSQWYMVKDSSNNWSLNSAIGGLDSFKAYQSTNTGDTYINTSNSTGVVRVNYETGSGTQFKVYGGSSSTLYASFTGTTAIQFPGLAASSGHNCLQVDNSGYVTNTGSACGAGSGSGSGTVNSGTSGQIAYYSSTGTVLSGISAVPLAAGGTGASTATGALANLGGAALTGATFTGAVQDGTTVLPNQVNPAAYGTVDPTGVASSTAAFQAAINTGQQVSVPPGLYNVCGLQIPDSMQLVGPSNDRQRQTSAYSGLFAAALTCASGDMFTVVGGTSQTYIGISGLKLISATGGGHIFNLGSSAYVVDFEMTDIFFSQNNPAKSWIVGSGGMQEMTMDHIYGTVAAGNTVPAVQLDGAINVMDIGDLNITSPGTAGSYSAHYLFEINQNSGSASNVHIHDSLCESATAGCFNLNAVGNASIDDVVNYDQPTTPTGPFITIGSASGQVELKSVTSLYGSASIPDLVCPAGVCEFHNSVFQVANLGGIIFDQRIWNPSHYLDYTPAQQTDASLMGVWSTKDGFSGGGMTGNLLTGSDGLTTGWYTVNGGAGSAPVTVTGITDPLGGTNAVQVTFGIGSGATNSDYSQYKQTITLGAGIYTLSAWVKACSGTATITLSNEGLQGQAFTVGAAWQRVFSTAQTSSGTSQIWLGLYGWTTPSAGTQCLDIYGVQFTPGIAINPYVSTTLAGTALAIQPRQVINGQPALYSSQPLGTGAFATIANYAPLASPAFTGTVSGITATMVGLGNVTNNAQTQAAIVPNTAPTAGQDLVGNAGGTAYASVTMSGDCARSSTGAITCTKSNGTALGTGAFATIANYAPLASPTFTGTVSGITATMVGLGNVTNNAQTQAAIVPNTAPTAGQDLVGNAGGTAYASVTMSGDCARSSTGAITCTKSNGTALGTGAFATIANYLTTASAASTYAPIFTLTTTGTSGAATYSGNVLNIPQYAGGGSMTWPTVAGFTVCTGTPCTAWGTSVGSYGSGSVLLGSGAVGTAAYQASSYFQLALTNPVTGPGSGVTVGHMAVMGNTAGTSITDGGAVPTLSSLGGAPLASPTFTGTVSGITATMVGLGNVTNNAQTQAAIVPNTAPTAGQDLVGNAGGTAYASVTMSGDCARSSTGAITCTKSNGTALGTGAFATIANYAPLASPTFTGTVSIPSGASISGFAPLVSPSFTTPALGTPASGVITNLTGTCTSCTASSANAVNSNTFPASAGFTSGGMPYFSSTTAMASSALLTHYGLVYGGGAAGTPVSLAACGANFPVVGSATAPACSTIGWLASATQWGIPYMSTATQMSTTGALTQYGVLLGGGSTTAPTATAAGATNTVLLGQGASTAPSFGALPLTALATQAANTVLVNNTAGAATPTAVAQVGISGGSPVKATNTYGCLNGYDHLGCVVWSEKATAQTTTAFPGTFNPTAAGLYRVSETACITTIGTAGTVQPVFLTGLSQAYTALPAGNTMPFTSPLGACSSERLDVRIPVSGSTYGVEPDFYVSGNVGGQYSVDVYAEYMGP